MVDVQQNQKKERALWKKLFDTDTDGKAVSELAATATATTRFPRHGTSLATPLATAVAIAVAANSD